MARLATLAVAAVMHRGPVRFMSEMDVDNGLLMRDVGLNQSRASR
jgi:hypothetical protein